MIKRIAIRQAVEAVMREHRLAALVYPTLRRKPARIGEPQAGIELPVERAFRPARAGLAGRLHARWRADRYRAAGRAFSEPQLLSLGYASSRRRR